MSALRTTTGTTSSAALRAARATLVFAAAGIASVCSGIPDWAVSAPLVLCYALLVAHTCCSVRCFGAIIPRGLRGQSLIDGVLVAIYLALAASLTDPVRFMAIATVLFAVATFKYAVLLGRLDALRLLARKVQVDTLGTIACSAALWAACKGHERAAGWTLLGLNVVANFYLLGWRPLYRLPAYRVGSPREPPGAHRPSASTVRRSPAGRWLTTRRR